jgi:hypothetical protein
MKLSFSTMRLLHECPHNYVNKISGVEQPESHYLVEGRNAHRIMQDHVSGKQFHKGFAHIKHEFNVVEDVDFDPKCKFSVFVDSEFNRVDIEEEAAHEIYGYIDGLNSLIEHNPTKMLEGKFSSSPWSASKYKKDAQRKIYGWAVPSLQEAILITGKRRPEEWDTHKIKTAKVVFTEQDHREAVEYMKFAVDKIQSGDLLSDLVDGRCTDPRCYWGENCMYK